jgi:uncharacterized protein
VVGASIFRPMIQTFHHLKKLRRRPAECGPFGTIAILLLPVLLVGGGDVFGQGAAGGHFQGGVDGFGSGPAGPGIVVTLDIDAAYRTLREGGISRQGWLEVGAVTVTGVGHLAFSAMDASHVFIPLAMAGWGGYIFHQARTDPVFLSRVGLTSENLGPAFRDATLVAGVSLGLMAVYGARQGTLRLDPDMVPLMALYPAWGLVQQFLVQGLMAGNLARLDGPAGSPWVVTPLAATLFGAVHLPSLDLAAGTFGIGLVFTPLYLRHGNIWPLGLYHGWLGVPYYFWVLDRNPWEYVR